MARGRKTGGRDFTPGQGGRPKGSKNVVPTVRAVLNAVHQANAANVEIALGKAATGAKTALAFQELRAKVNREIGLGSGEAGAGGVTIILMSNIEAGKFASARARALPLEASQAAQSA